MEHQATVKAVSDALHRKSSDRIGDHGIQLRLNPASIKAIRQTDQDQGDQKGKHGEAPTRHMEELEQKMGRALGHGLKREEC
jgi:hypothetical protein